MHHTDQPHLRNLRVASPCHENWDAMPGGERVRSCARCQHKVYNLSEMTTDEAERLLRETEGRLCVRFYRRHDGTILTKDCTAGAQDQRRRRVAAVTAGVAAAVSSAALALRPAASPTEAPTPRCIELPLITETAPAPEPVMGDVAIPQPQHEMGEVMGKVAVPEPEPRMGRVVMGAVAASPRTLK